MHVERQALFWLIASVVLVLLIGTLKEILLPFVAGILIAYGLNPIANFLERRGVSRGIASILVVFGFLVLFVMLLVFLVPVVVDQARQFIVALPDTMAQLKTVFSNMARDTLGARAGDVQAVIDRVYDSVSSNWDGLAQFAAESLWTQGGALFNIATLLLITPLVVFYLLVDWNPMLAKVDSWLPRDHADQLRQVGSDVNGAVGAFVRGQGLVCLTLGLFYALGLSLVGLNYGLLIGIATGVMAFVPFVGWTLGMLTGVTLAVVQFWPDVLRVLLVLGVFLAGQGLDAGFLSPKIVGSRIGLHPVWLIFALFAFSYLFGIVGVLVAVPMAAAVGVLVRFGLKAYLGSTVYSGVETETPSTDGTSPGV